MYRRERGAWAAREGANAFSKKVLNLSAAVALHFMYYNFCRVHQTLKTTPAVASGLADHEWSIEELVGVLD